MAIKTRASEHGKFPLVGSGPFRKGGSGGARPAGSSRIESLSAAATDIYDLRSQAKPYPHQSTHQSGLKLSGGIPFVRFMLSINLANVYRRS